MPQIMGPVFPYSPTTESVPPAYVVWHWLFRLDGDQNLKELAMAYAIRSTINWLDRKGTQALAEELVNDFADGTANDVLAKILTEYKDGTRLERGKTVYIRNLMGAMGALCPELVSAVMSGTTQRTEGKSRFR